jgi:hypothetical protein
VYMNVYGFILGSCNLHICHNVFLKGLEAFGLDVDDFIINLYYFFHGWPQRQEDYLKIQVELKISTSKFIKHIKTRWLTMLDSCQRVLEQWPAIRKYFHIHSVQKEAVDQYAKIQSYHHSFGRQMFKTKIAFHCRKYFKYYPFYSIFSKR